MREERLRVGLDNTQPWAIRVDPTAMMAVETPLGIRFRLAPQTEGDLPPGHCQIDIRQDLGIEQSPVQVAMPIIDPVSLA
jgi:hypothetical protein